MVDVSVLDREDIAKIELFLKKVKVENFKGIVSLDTKETIKKIAAELMSISAAHKNTKLGVADEAPREIIKMLREIVVGLEDDRVLPIINEVIKVLKKLEK